MPFGPLAWPSIGLSLLKAGLGDRRAATRIRYFTIDFADRIGSVFYSEVSNSGVSR